MSKPKLTPWYPASVKPVRKGMYRVQDNSLRCSCCWMEMRWNGTDWLTDTFSPPGVYTTLVFNVRRWRGLAAQGAQT